MRNQMINKTKHFVLNYRGKEQTKDTNGNYTGEYTIVYSRPIAFMGHISGAKGGSQIEMFGIDENYDKVVLISKKLFEKLKITENSVFFIDKKLQYKDTTPLYDYRVKRISETINEVAIALIKVEN